MPEIKIRQVRKGTIKSLDRAAAMTYRLKDVQTRTKEFLDDPRTRDSSSLDEYASNRITGMVQDACGDAVFAAEKTASWSAGKIRGAAYMRGDRSVSAIRNGRYIRFRRRQLAEKEVIGRQRSIRNFANNRQLARTKGKERAIREFARQRIVVDSRKRSLQSVRITKRAARRTGRMVQRTASAMTGYLVGQYAEKCPDITIVEPESIACIYESAKKGLLQTVKSDYDTIMAGLNCGSPCTITWPTLRDCADHFLKCPDWVAAHGMRTLANPIGNDPKMISGESGAATIGALSVILECTDLASIKQRIGLDENSVVVLISTEGDTDPQAYRDIVEKNKFPSEIK